MLKKKFLVKFLAAYRILLENHIKMKRLYLVDVRLLAYEMEDCCLSHILRMLPSQLINVKEGSSQLCSSHFSKFWATVAIRTLRIERGNSKEV